ncbi:MAG: acetyl-CoA carboxylase biotin carboxyl carrier protein [Anaeroplasma sp.]
MNFEDVEKIIKIFENSKVTFMDLELEGFKIKLDKRGLMTNSTSKAICNETPLEEDALDTNEYVTSPLVGTFHCAQSVGMPPFVTEGCKVKKGDKLCIIEAMKVMNEITAPHDGIIERVLVNDGQMVEYGQNLFVIGE